MASAGLQIIAVAMICIGFASDVFVCWLPMWKVSAFVGSSDVVTAQTFWEGLWMNCVKQSTGQMQCKVYDAMLALPRDLQVSRALVVVSILVSFLGILLGVAGGNCTDCCVEEGRAKRRVLGVAGVCALVGGTLCLVPVSWSAHEVIRTFYNPVVADAQRRELGASLFVGWGAAGLLLIGGGILVSHVFGPPEEKRFAYRARYASPRPPSASERSANAYV